MLNEQPQERIVLEIFQRRPKEVRQNAFNPLKWAFVRSPYRKDSGGVIPTKPMRPYWRRFRKQMFRKW